MVSKFLFEVEFETLFKNYFCPATLSGVETLKYPPFHGIQFSDGIFSFGGLVGDSSFRVSEISQKTDLTISNKVLIHLHI